MNEDSQHKPDVAAIMREVEARAAAAAAYDDPAGSRAVDELRRIAGAEDLNRARSALDDINRFFEELKSAFNNTSALRAGGEMRAAADQSASAHGLLHPKGSVAALRAVFLRRQTAFNNLTMDMISRHAEAMERLFLALAQYLGAMNAALPTLIAAQEQLLRCTIDTAGKVDTLLGHYPAIGELADLRAAMEEHAQNVNALTPHAAAEKLEPRLNALTAHLKLCNDSHAELERRVDTLSAQLETLAAERRSSSTDAGRIRTSPSHFREDPGTGELEQQSATDEAPLLVPNFNFLDFEGETRGGEATIEEQQRKYLQWFRGAQNVLDGGCGRGEFLELLRAAGIDSYGVDSDTQMVAHCRSKGLRVEETDLLPHLRDLPAESLGGLFLAQVVEHLQPATLALLCRLAFEKLRPGAAVVMETINPTCLTTFSGAFYADPTHVKPIHPKALEYLLQAAGFDKPTIIFSAPVPEEQRLAPISESTPIDPAVKELVLQMNRNFERLNSVLYSYGNYAAAVRKAGGEA